MDRRLFIKQTSLAAAFVSVSASLPSEFLNPSSPKVKIFVLRGVSYTDAFHAFNQLPFTNTPEFHIRQTLSSNTSYTHQEGIEELMNGKTYTLVKTQELERHTVSEVLDDVFTEKLTAQVIYCHYTEIGHSHVKSYQETLTGFFGELVQKMNPSHHKVIVTTDIGRNAQNNPCGGRDHNNETCLDTFAIYMGKNASKLVAAGNDEKVPHKNVLSCRF